MPEPRAEDEDHPHRQVCFAPLRLGPIATYTSGRGSGRPVVFLHGVFFDHRLWDAFLAPLADHPLVTVDMPDHGASTAVRRDWTLAGCAGMLLDLLEYLDLRDAVVVGHSWGAMTALRAAARDGGRIGGLVLLNAPMRAPSTWSAGVRSAQATLAGLPRFYGGQAARSLYGAAFAEARPDLVAALQGRLARMGARAVRRTVRAILVDAEDGYAALDGVAVPTEFVTATGDYVRSEAPPGATVLADGGHVSPHDHPTEVLAIVERALEVRSVAALIRTPSAAAPV